MVFCGGEIPNTSDCSGNYWSVNYEKTGQSHNVWNADGPYGPDLITGYTTLKKKIAGTIVTNDKNNIALNTAPFGGHLSQIYTTGPSLGDFKFDGWFPLAFAKVVLSDWRIGLRVGFKGIKALH